MTDPLNTEYFANLTTQVNRVRSCSELETLTIDAFTSINELKASIAAQLAIIQPMLALLTAPTNPTELLTWAQNYITHVLTAQLAAYPILQAKQIALLAQITALTTAITHKASTFTDCTVTPP